MEVDVLVVDYGYGDVKYLFEDGNTLIKKKFPDAIARVNRFLDNSDFTGDFTIRYLNKEWIVGEEASLHSPIATRSFDYLVKYSPLLTAKIMLEHNIEKIHFIATGVALSDFFRNKELKKSLKAFSFNEKAVSVEDIFVYPQGFGIYLDYCYEVGDKEKEVMIIDIGYNTLDIGYVNKEGKFSTSKSKSYFNDGVVKMIHGLEEFIRKEITPIQLNEQDVKEALERRKIRIAGTEHDLSTIISELSEEYAEYIMRKLSSDYSGIFLKSSKVIFAGGGAVYVKDFVKEKWGNVFIPEEPEFANVRGYYYGIKGE